jgi:hypothetical protein
VDGEDTSLRREIIEQLKAIAFSDVRDVLQPATLETADGTVIQTFVPADPQTWSDATASAIARLKFHPPDKGGGLMEVALWPKMDAIKQLALLIGDDATRAIEHAHAATPTVRRFAMAKDITPPADPEPEPAWQASGDGEGDK